MKKNFILKAVPIIILVVFLPLLIACPPHPPKPDEKGTLQPAQEVPQEFPLQPTLQGEIKDSSSTLQENVRVRYGDGYQTCSQLQPKKGWYSFQLDNAGVKTVTYRRKNYKMKRESVTFPAEDSTITRDVILDNSNPQIEISGYVGVQKKDITVNLYQLQCVYTLVASMKTCADGTYSFTSLEDGSDLPTGTYKVEAVCSGICTFVPSSKPDIPVPHSPQSYDFNTASCGDGECP